jgi:hypothetical protein
MIGDENSLDRKLPDFRIVSRFPNNNNNNNGITIIKPVAVL